MNLLGGLGSLVDVLSVALGCAKADIVSLTLVAAMGTSSLCWGMLKSTQQL